MAQARSNIPTITEKLKDRTLATPSFVSRSLNEYEARRPNYVNPDRNAGSGMAALARSLSSFQQEFDKTATNRLDKMVEEHTARGDHILKSRNDSEEALRNRTSWKELIKEHPEYAGLSPWVGIGYERSRLRELGMEMKSGLKKYLDENGLLNAEDPKMLQGGINTYIKNFREQVGIESYEDKLLVAENFSPIEAEARQSVTSTYDAMQMAQRESKMIDQYRSEVTTLIVTSMESDVPIDTDAVNRIIQEACDNGMEESSKAAVILGAFQAAYATTKDRDILDDVKNIVVSKDAEGKDVKLMDIPEAARWWRTETDKNTHEDEMNARKARIDQAEHIEKLSASIAADCFFGDKAGKITREEGLELLTKRLGREPDPQERMQFNEEWNKAMRIQNSSVSLDNSTPQSQLEQLEMIDKWRETLPFQEFRQAVYQEALKGSPVAMAEYEKLMNGTDSMTKQLADMSKKHKEAIEDFAENAAKDLSNSVLGESTDSYKNNTYVASFTQDLVRAYTTEYYSAVRAETEAMKKNLPEGRTSLTVDEELEVRNKALERLRNDVVIPRKYYDRFNTTEATLNKDKIEAPYWLGGIPAEETPAVMDNLRALNNNLQSSSNNTSFRSVNDMYEDIDVVSMLRAGVVNPSPQDYVNYSRNQAVKQVVVSPDARSYKIPPEAFTSNKDATAIDQWLRSTFPNLKGNSYFPSPVTAEERTTVMTRTYSPYFPFIMSRPVSGLDSAISNQEARMFCYALDLMDIDYPVSVDAITAMSKTELYDSIPTITQGLKNILFYRAGLLEQSDIKAPYDEVSGKIEYSRKLRRTEKGTEVSGELTASKPPKRRISKEETLMEIYL